MVADIIEAAIQAQGVSVEAISTEDMLSLVDKITEELKKMNLSKDDAIVASLDVKGLYPALDIPVVTKIAAKMVMESGLRMAGINYTWAVIYLALDLSKAEIKRRGLEKLVPVKKERRGRPPTILSIGEDVKSQERWKFVKPTTFFTSEEKAKVMESVLEIMILTTFGCHVYRWV